MAFFRSVLSTIPDELKEVESLQIAGDPTQSNKTLGLKWNSIDDSLYVYIPDLQLKETPTKRDLASSVACIFDVHGWFGPATICTKILLQQVWIRGTDWDKPISPDLATSWKAWCQELPCLKLKGQRRSLFNSAKTVEAVQIHGFSDASSKAYGGVVFLRVRYVDTSIEVILVTSRSRVVPVKGQTIPRLELCGAHLLSKLLKATTKDLDIPIKDVYAWTDSEIVLAWIKSSPSRLKVFVSHRVRKIVNNIPHMHWHYVPTLSNPADLESRGVSPCRLLEKSLWWNGPPCLARPPDCWPPQTSRQKTDILPDIKTALAVKAQPVQFFFWKRYSSWRHLIKIVSWIVRLINRHCGKHSISNTLTETELRAV